MKSTFALSLSLVAFSGGAGLGLSAYHDFSTSVQSASLEQPEIINDGSSGFVIPNYVPAINASMSASVLAAPTRPAVFKTPDLSSQTEQPTLVALNGPAVDAETIAPLAAPKKNFVKQESAPKFIRQAKPQAASASTVAASGPQAFNDFEEFVPKNAPKYVVGVYR